MHGYETKELRKAHLEALVAEKASAEARLAHAEESIAAGAEGPEKAYHERVAERAKSEAAAVDEQLAAFGSKASTKRARASQR